MTTEGTCSFSVPCKYQALVEFFSKTPLSQLLPMEPDQQHPVTMLSITVLTCGQTHSSVYRQESKNSSCTDNLKTVL